MRRINVSELAELVKSDIPELLDVREPWEFDICQIEGSINLPMGQIPGGIEQIDRSKETVVICHHGVRSLQVIQYLSQQGFTNLINLDGGIDAWARQLDINMAVY
ncbi:MAG: rhodanese-related sulfurtransferase [Gammaproteobacteria bacterium]|jgi:rhodanese-related sulfurtransferase